MDIRILHRHEPGFGWSFDSPDIPGLIGGTDAYDPAEAERAARFALECAAEEAGRPVPASMRVEHFIPPPRLSLDPPMSDGQAAQRR